MGKLIDIETIRKEIEKKLEFLKNQQEESGGFGALVLIGKNAAYNEVLSFLDNLPEEKIVDYLNVNLGSPDYARGFEHGREAQMEKQLNMTDEDKVIDYLVNKKGYPICTSGNIPSYEETFDAIKNAVEYQKSLEEKPVDLEKEVEEVWKHYKVVNPISYDGGYEVQLDKHGLLILADKFFNLGKIAKKD